MYMSITVLFKRDFIKKGSKKSIIKEEVSKSRFIALVRPKQ